MKEGGPAIKVRTVGPKAQGERWSAIAIKNIVATQDMPNPKDDSQKHPRSERNTRSLDFGASGGQFLPKQGVRHELALNRNFRINSRILEKYGPTMGCKGCEDKMTGDDARPHSSECRARLEEQMRGDDVEAEIIARRNDKREQRAKVIAERNKAKAEEGSEPRTAPQSQQASSSSNGQQERQAEANNAKRKPDDTEEPGQTRSKKQRMACLSGRAKIEESVKSVLDQLIEEDDKSIRALCTHEVVEGIIDSLNEVCTRKVMKELSKAEAAQPGCNVDITKANASLPMTNVAAKLGYKSGFVSDLTTEDVNGRKWDLSDLKTQNEAEAKLREEAPWLLALSLPSTVFATTQSLNFARQSDKLMERKKVLAHTSFAVKLCVMQSKSGRTFMIKQPVGARARGTRLMNKLLFGEGRWEGELRHRHVRNEVSQGARSQTGEEEDEHHQQLAGVAQGVGEVPGKWNTPTRHDAGVENHGMPDVQQRVLQNRVREHHEGEEQFRQHTIAGTQRGQGHDRNDQRADQGGPA